MVVAAELKRYVAPGVRRPAANVRVALDYASEDKGADGKRRLKGVADEIIEVVLLELWRRDGAVRVDEPRYVQIVELGVERIEVFGVEWLGAAAGAGRDPVEPELLDGPIKLVRGGRPILERNRCQGRELAGVLTLERRGLLVLNLGELDRHFSGEVINVEHPWPGRHGLTIDSGSLHVGQPKIDVVSAFRP